jgi:hypothetical protein
MQLEMPGIIQNHILQGDFFVECAKPYIVQFIGRYIINDMDKMEIGIFP